MLFNSYIFIFLFFPLVLLGYYGLNHAGRYKAALIFLTLMSFWFYGYQNIYYLPILIFSILFNYAITSAMSRFSAAKWRRLCLYAGFAFNIGILFYFKYYDFFLRNLNMVFKTELPLLHLLLPLGISFYTFQQLSYVIDSYRGECEGYGFVEYAAYVSYFPQLIAGPIVYHSELIPQFRDIARKKPDFHNMSKGLYAFSLGLAKKVLLADTFSRMVNAGYDNISSLNTSSALLVMLGYSLQIYFDFSGYCDMAYGIGYLMNIRLPRNFNSPYRSQSVSEFWDRWHMTLTRFFTRYVYIPLGGNRKGQARTYLNVMAVFLVSGLWHGANWTFILWGVLHGAVTVGERMAGKLRLRLPQLVRVIFTFTFVTFAWSLFRADSLTDACLLWKQLFTGGFGPVYEPVTAAFQETVEMSFLYHAGLGAYMTRFPWLLPALFTAACLGCCFYLPNTQDKTERLKLTVPKMLVVVLLMLWSILSLSEISEFLYFNF